MAQPVEFFAYDSLLDQRTMKEVAGEWDVCVPSRLADHRIRFARADRAGAETVADLEPAPGERVFGVVYRIFSGQFLSIRSRRPDSVERRLTVETGEEEPLLVTTLVLGAPGRATSPDRRFVRRIEEGMRQHGFSAEIRSRLWTWAGLDPGGRD